MSLYYLDEQADWYSFYYLFKTPIFALMYIVLFLGEVILLTRIFQKDLTPGQYSIYNPVYVKNGLRINCSPYPCLSSNRFSPLYIFHGYIEP